jgi:hypothetical protein
MWMATRDRVLTTDEMCDGLLHTLAADTAEHLRSALAEQHKLEMSASREPACCACSATIPSSARPMARDQPSLYHQLKQLPWRQIPIGHTEDHHGHGRTERRSIKVVTVEPGLEFPHAAQAIVITRKTRPRRGGRWKTVTVYAITSLLVHQARPDELATWIRQHWQIEALHHIRDVTYREDASHVRTGSGPAVMAALRNLTISILKLCGWTNIAQANRRHLQDARRCLTTLGLTTGHQDP